MGYEVWSYEGAVEYMDKVYQYVLNNEGCYTLSEATTQTGEYEAVIEYLERKYATKFESIKKAKDILKSRCLKLGMDGKTNATMTIFNLVNNFDMINTNAKSNISAKVESSHKDFSKLSDEEVIRLNEITKKLGNTSGDI